jgi:hypothetical protein
MVLAIRGSGVTRLMLSRPTLSNPARRVTALSFSEKSAMAAVLNGPVAVMIAAQRRETFPPSSVHCARTR